MLDKVWPARHSWRCHGRKGRFFNRVKRCRPEATKETGAFCPSFCPGGDSVFFPHLCRQPSPTCSCTQDTPRPTKKKESEGGNCACRYLRKVKLLSRFSPFRQAGQAFLTPELQKKSKLNGKFPTFSLSSHGQCAILRQKSEPCSEFSSVRGNRGAAKA